MMQLVQEAQNSQSLLRGNVVLMHDSGGDRSRLGAPAQADRCLRAKGYTFVPLSELGGFKRDEVMPHLPLDFALCRSGGVFDHQLCLAIPLLLFSGAIVLGVARLLVLVGLALWKRARDGHTYARHRRAPAR